MMVQHLIRNGILFVLTMILLSSCEDDVPQDCLEEHIVLDGICRPFTKDECYEMWRGRVDFYCLSDSLWFAYDCSNGKVMNRGGGSGVIEYNDLYYGHRRCYETNGTSVSSTGESTALVMPQRQDVGNRSVVEAKVYHMAGSYPQTEILDSTSVIMYSD